MQCFIVGMKDSDQAAAACNTWGDICGVNGRTTVMMRGKEKRKNMKVEMLRVKGTRAKHVILNFPRDS